MTRNMKRQGNEDGWKFDKLQWENLLEGEMTGEENFEEMEELIKRFKASHAQEAPPKVKAVPRLLKDLESLETLFEGDVPRERLIRGVESIDVIYGFGDASGAGFGSSWKTGDSIKYRYGLWGSDLGYSGERLLDLLRRTRSRGLPTQSR